MYGGGTIESEGLTSARKKLVAGQWGKQWQILTCCMRLPVLCLALAVAHGIKNMQTRTVAKHTCYSGPKTAGENYGASPCGSMKSSSSSPCSCGTEEWLHDLTSASSVIRGEAQFSPDQPTFSGDPTTLTRHCTMEDAARADGNCTGNGNLPGLAEYFEHEFLRKQRGLLYSIHKTCPYGKEKWPWITTISGMCSNTGFRSTYDRSFDAAGMVRNTTLTEMLHLLFLQAHALKSFTP